MWRRTQDVAGALLGSGLGYYRFLPTGGSAIQRPAFHPSTQRPRNGDLGLGYCRFVPTGGSAVEADCGRIRILMAHTHCSLLYHCVFSTKDREKTIAPERQTRLWSYIGGIVRERGWKALAVGGTEDHVHLLLSLPSSVAIANAMREIKHGSSRWMHEDGRIPGFEWQEGYGAFSIGWSQIEATSAYIAGQMEHHRKRDFQAEFVAFLKKNCIEYDERHVWG
jgi:putative transposase